MPILRTSEEMERLILFLECNAAMRQNVSGYRSFPEFETDFSRASTLPKALGYGWTTSEQKKDAFIVYARSGWPAMDFLVFGRKAMGQFTGWESSVVYPLIDNKTIVNMEVLSQEYGKHGSVLDAFQWSFLMNDMMVLGAVANRTPVNLASGRNFLTLWDLSGRHETIFARELVGLFIAGYELKRFPDGSEILYPPKGRPVELSLEKYMSRMPAYLGLREIKDMAHPGLLKMLYNSSNDSVISVRRALPDPSEEAGVFEWR